MQDYYQQSYLPKIIHAGKLTCWLGIAMILAPVLCVSLLFNIRPEIEPLTVALVAQLSVNVVWWFIEPISYFPILGIPGTYIAFLSGNGGNLRMPCAAAAQRAANVQPGTNEGAVVSTIGICCSVFVNVILLTIGVILGSSVLGSLPPAVTENLQMLLPALFGAVFAQFAIDDLADGIVAMVLAIGAYFLYTAGWFNWIPIDPSIGTILLPIFGTVVFAKLWYGKRMKSEEQL